MLLSGSDIGCPRHGSPRSIDPGLRVSQHLSWLTQQCRKIDSCLVKNQGAGIQAQGSEAPPPQVWHRQTPQHLLH